MVDERNSKLLIDEISLKFTDLLQENRCWMCSHKVPDHELSSHAKRSLPISNNKIVLHTECIGNFLNMLTLEQYETKSSKVELTPRMISHAQYIYEKDLCNFPEDVLHHVVRNAVLNLAYNAPHHCVLYPPGVSIDKIESPQELSTIIKVNAAVSPACFICKHQIVLYRTNYSPWDGSDSLLAPESFAVPVEEKLYQLHTNKHFYHEKCMSELVNYLIIEAY